MADGHPIAAPSNPVVPTRLAAGNHGKRRGSKKEGSGSVP